MRHPMVRALTGILLVFAPVPLTLIPVSKLVDRSARILWPQILAGLLCFLAYRFFVHRVERRAMTEFGRQGALREIGTGLGFGALQASLVFALLAVMGVYSVEGVDGMTMEILRRTGTDILVGVHEEMLFRGIVFAILAQSFGGGVAIVGSATLFGLGHLLAEGASTLGIVNSMAAGVTLAAAYLVTRRLWLPIGMHIAWNFTVGRIFSAVVSGHGTEPGLLRGTLAGPDWLTGGQFGVEASIVSLILDAVASTLLLWLAVRKGSLTLSPHRERVAEAPLA